MRRDGPITTIADLSSTLRKASASRRRTRPRLDLAGLDAILSIDEVSGIVHVEVGARVAKVEEALRREGLTLRRDPPLHPNATIFEGLAELGDALCGMEAVLPDGRAMRIRPSPRRAVGPDLLALATGAGPRVFMPCAVYLRARRVGDTPWVAHFRCAAVAPSIGAVQALLRRGVRPVSIELRAPARGACEGRIEVNAPAQVRAASESIVHEEIARVEGATIETPGWPDFGDVTEQWLPYADLAAAHARARLDARLVRFDLVGAELRFARIPTKRPTPSGPSPAFEAALDRLCAIVDPKRLIV